MALALQRFPRPPNMRRSSSCAERWTGTASSPTATIVNASPADQIRRRRLAQFRARPAPLDAERQGSRARGVAAVLINPSHTYPDLALFIDAAQERFLHGDRRRAFRRQILRGAGKTIGDEQSRQFFRRLWEHDLIVFDAATARSKVGAPSTVHFAMIKSANPNILVNNFSNTLAGRQCSTKGGIDLNETMEDTDSGASLNIGRLDA